MYDVVIIGGGVIGCAVARELSRYELDILLLEKTADICNGQSKANTAIVHGGYDAKPGTLKAKFNILGNAMFDKLCAELDVPFERNGSLVVSYFEEDDPKLYELLERGRQNGCKDMRIVGHDELLQMGEKLNPSVSKGLFVPTGGIVCPYELTQAFAENAAHNGVEFLRSAEVKGISRNEDGAWLVQSEAGDFTAKAIVNCAGLYSDEINNMVSKDKLHITPRRGEYYIVDKKHAGAFHSAIFPVPSKMGKGILVARTVDGTILLGPTAEDVNDKLDTRTTAMGLEKALEGAKRTWADLPSRDFITTFSGLRAHCDRDDFVLGEPGDCPMFFNAAGIESPGLSSAPAIAQYLGGMIAEKLGAKENKAFDPIRKGIPKFRDMSDDERREAIRLDPDYAKIVCRCETVTEAEIREAIRRDVGARTLDGIKRRTRAGMGRCQAGFCTGRTLEILCEELGISPLEASKFGGGSKLIISMLFREDNGNA